MGPFNPEDTSHDVTDNETRIAPGRPEPAVTTSETAALMQQARLSVAASGLTASGYPSRRSLRSAAPVTAQTVDAAPAVATPAAPGSRRAAREARAAAQSAAPVTIAAAQSAAPVTIAAAIPAELATVPPSYSVPPTYSVPPAPQVAAPFGTFAAPAPAAAPATAPVHPSRRSQRERGAAGRPAARPVAATAPRASAAAPVSVRKRLSAAGTMVLVGGLFVSLTLPAYASNDYAGELADAPAANVVAQTLALDETAVEAASAIEARDTYETTSAVELRRLYLDALRQQRLQEYLASGHMAMGDDYPWATELGMGQGGGLSPLNYFVRQCTDFVAWRLNRDAGSTRAPFKYVWSNLTPGAGSARSWKSQWERHGWPISSTPAPGWVAWFPGGNHVAYVNSVLPDGSVFIEEYNWGPDTYNQRIIPAESAIYLSPPPR